MDTIFINSENSKTSKSHFLLLKLTNKLDLRIGEKVIPSPNFSIYYIWKNIKGSYNNNKFKISVPTWNDEFELPDVSYSVSDIQDYFKYILEKHGENIEYVNKIKNRITCKVKKAYSLELLTPEAIKLVESTKNEITEDKKR